MKKGLRLITFWQLSKLLMLKNNSIKYLRVVNTEKGQHDLLRPKKKKILNRTRRILNLQSSNVFFNRFSGDILFSFLKFFAFFVFLFFFLFCLYLLLLLLLLFWISKYIFWYTFNYTGGWVINKFSPGRFPETRLLFVWPYDS